MNEEKQQVATDLSEFLSKVAVIPLDELSMDDSLDTLGVDSAAIISLSMHLEEQYAVLAEADDLPKSSTIRQITDFVLAQQGVQYSE